MSSITAEQALVVLREAELLCTPSEVEAALDRLAAAVSVRLENCDPLVLVVMKGALFPGAWLLSRLGFPLQLDYLHVTRYRGDTRGGELAWIAPLQSAIAGRTVLVIDDILDEGDTLKAIMGALRQQGAAAVHSAVLVNKQHARKVSGLTVDFVGLEVPDRYVFGCGMDYKEYWRQLPAIYAARD